MSSAPSSLSAPTAFSKALRTSDDTGAKPRSAVKPIFMPDKDIGVASNSGGVTGKLAASRTSWPAMTSNSSATSRTVLPIGPVCASEAQEGGENPGARDTRPNVGLMPNTPQNEEGTRMEPTPSVPSASGPQPAATAAAAPPLDPPLVRSTRHGLRVIPETGLSAVSL